MRKFAFLILFLLVACGSPGATNQPTPSNTIAIAVQVIVTLDGQLLQIDLPSQAQTVLTTLEPGQSARFPALAPNGRQIAFSLQTLADEPEPGQAFAVPTSQLAVLVPGAESYEIIYDPPEAMASIINAQWSADGTYLYATLEEILTAEEDGMFLGYSYTILEIDGSTYNATRVVENARDPAPAPDGSGFIYVDVKPNQTPELWRYTDGETTQLLVDEQFVAIEAPLWSADDQIYFVGAIQQQSAAPAWWEAPRASAHGGEWSPWRIQLTGKDLQRFPVLAAVEDPRLALNQQGLFLWSFPGLWYYEGAEPTALPKPIWTPGDIGGLVILP